MKGVFPEGKIAICFQSNALYICYDEGQSGVYVLSVAFGKFFSSLRIRKKQTSRYRLKLTEAVPKTRFKFLPEVDDEA